MVDDRSADRWARIERRVAAIPPTPTDPIAPVGRPAMLGVQGRAGMVSTEMQVDERLDHQALVWALMPAAMGTQLIGQMHPSRHVARVVKIELAMQIEAAAQSRLHNRFHMLIGNTLRRAVCAVRSAGRLLHVTIA